MKGPTLLEGIAIAVVAALVGGLMLPILSVVLAPGLVLRLLISGAGLFYLFYLFHRNHRRQGRIIVMVLWLLVSILTWIFTPSLVAFIALHLLIIWLIRSLYFYSGVLAALLDLALTALAFCAAMWAWSASGNLSLAFWSLFLVQALFVFIPRYLPEGCTLMSGPADPDSASDKDEEVQASFDNAHHCARQALRKLAES